MCGICGVLYFDPKRPVVKETLYAMTDRLRHRGPDSEGYFTSPGIGLGVRRLRIIDLFTGDPPILNETGRIVLVCNGEIYNYKELRQFLIQKGHRLRTSSDIEVIIHLYEEYGEGCLSYLRGMFALALWDADARKLFLARDRMGIKPLNYAVTKEGIYFGSEQKSILAANGIDQKQIDIDSLRDIFSFGFITGDKTMFAGIRRLLPAQYLVCRDGNISMKIYWQFDFSPAENEEKMTTEAWAEALRDKIRESVTIHLRSDVEVGAWLSPGIDSSTIVSMMTAQKKSLVRTFSLGFDNKNVDEIGRKKTLDQFEPYPIDSKRIVFTNDHFNLLPETIRNIESPCLTGTFMCIKVLSESASESVKVVLTGEGSDELLGGYQWYLDDKLLHMVSRLPMPSKQIIALFPFIKKKWPRGSRLVSTPIKMNPTRFRRFSGHIGIRGYMNRLFTDDIGVGMMEDGDPEINDVPSDFKNLHYFQQMQYYDLKLRLPNYITHNLDMITMSCSLEARVPFLDHELVEFCLRMPPHIKLKRFQEKYILRKAMKNHLPSEICNRKKWGLRSPHLDWLREDLPDFANEMFSEGVLKEKGYFNPSFVADMLKRYREGDSTWGSVLMGILNVQLWDEIFMKTLDRPNPYG